MAAVSERGVGVTVDDTCAASAVVSLLEEARKQKKGFGRIELVVEDGRVSSARFVNLEPSVQVSRTK
jgi:hypothetical protein